MRRWFHGRHDWETPEAEVDLRIGGAVRVVMRDPERTSSTAAAVGTPRSIPHPPGVHLDLGRRPRETLIELDFEEADGVTTVRFTHSNLRDQESVRSHEDGWNTCFDNLEEGAGSDWAVGALPQQTLATRRRSKRVGFRTCRRGDGGCR